MTNPNPTYYYLDNSGNDINTLFLDVAYGTQATTEIGLSVDISGNSNDLTTYFAVSLTAPNTLTTSTYYYSPTWSYVDISQIFAPAPFITPSSNAPQIVYQSGGIFTLTFTSSLANFTILQDLSNVSMTLVGGGGGGGGAGNANSTDGSSINGYAETVGGGGGGGGQVVQNNIEITPGIYPITIGSGGGGGAGHNNTAGNNGGSGGSTNFGSSYSANGGSAGEALSTPYNLVTYSADGLSGDLGYGWGAGGAGGANYQAGSAGAGSLDAKGSGDGTAVGLTPATSGIQCSINSNYYAAGGGGGGTSNEPAGSSGTGSSNAGSGGIGGSYDISGVSADGSAGLAGIIIMQFTWPN
jgi:hypothetical protein